MLNWIQKTGFLLLAVSCISLQAVAQSTSGTIRGSIINEQQEPVSDINIHLLGTGYGAASTEDGTYRIDNIPVGEYTFVISGIGYQKQETSISVESKETLMINAVLSISDEEIQEIVLEKSKINKYTRENSSYVGKMPIKKINNPQVYTTISSELLKDQVVTSFDDALKNAPGIFKLWESTGRGGDGAGYYALRGFAVQPTMVNGFPSLTNGTLDPANVEAIEVIKGPSGTLYGSSLVSYGGLINVVTKKPHETFNGEFSYKTGSFGLNRITADVNAPIGKKPIAVRVNSSYHIENSFQDAGQKESFFVAPSVAYDASDRLSFLVNTEFYTSEHTNPTMLFLNRTEPLAAENLGQLNYDSSISYTSNDLTIQNPAFKLQGEMKYQLSNNWTSQTVISRSSAKADGYYSYLWDIADGNGTYIRYITKQNSTTLGTDIQQNFIGDFNVAGLENKIVAGLDFYEQNGINNSTGYIGFDQVSLLDPSTSGISRSAVDTALANAPVENNTVKQQVYSAYISNVVNIMPTLSAMASLRIDHFNNHGNIITNDDNFTQTALSPKFGLVFQPLQDRLSLFANYMNGFSNVAPRVQNDGSTRTFSPEQANQWETGIKGNLFDGRLSTTLSYYDIRVSNVVRTDPERVNFFIQDGENYSRGIDMSVTAAPMPGLNIMAGYSHNESEVTKTDSDEYLGRRPESAGPEDLINGWVSYELQNSTFRGLGFGFGGNYSGENMILNGASPGTFTLPSYTILNASIFYDTDSYRMDLKVNNLSDKEYYKGWSTINPQAPRSITANFSYKF
ncbi:MAG: TonB-dependent receptor [Balneolales bacterium]